MASATDGPRPPAPGEMSAEDYRAWLASRRGRKYRNVPTVVDGLRFDSKGEAARWGELRLLERAGAIADLRRQVVYPLEVNGVLVAAYVADFVYLEGGETVVEDYKSAATRTAAYRLKAKLMLACHGIRVRETGV